MVKLSMIELNKEVIENMVIAQFKLNAGIAGPRWVLGLTKDSKIINWARYCFMEGVEAIDSYPYKHWKAISSEVDKRNVKIELSDIWHFLLSNVIENEFNFYFNDHDINTIDIKDEQFEIIFMNAIKDKVVNILSTYTYSNENSLKSLERASDKSEFKELPYFEKFVSLTADMSIEKMNSDIKLPDYDINLMVYIFHKICSIVSLNIEVLYYAKGELNKFRQLNGYKDGTYIKNWTVNGVVMEDNVVLFDLVDQNIKTEDLITSLDTIYKSMTPTFKLTPKDREILHVAYSDHILKLLKNDFKEKDYEYIYTYITGEGSTQTKNLTDKELVDEIISDIDNSHTCLSPLMEIINKYI